MDFKTFLNELSKFPEQTVIQTGHAGRTFHLQQGFSPNQLWVYPSALIRNRNGFMLAVYVTPDNCSFALTTIAAINNVLGKSDLPKELPFLELTTLEAQLFIENAS